MSLITRDKCGKRKSDNQSYKKAPLPISNHASKTVNQAPTQTYPHFIMDENMPKYTARQFRIMGYDVDDVREIPQLGRGTKDEKIKNFAEKENLIVLTRDGPSFPEPKEGGDRIAIVDKNKMDTPEEILMRLKQLGLNKPRYRVVKTLKVYHRERIITMEVIDIDHGRKVALVRSPDRTAHRSKATHIYFVIVKNSRGEWISGSPYQGPTGHDKATRYFNVRRFRGK